ncbi:hypothetical protein ACFST9_14825 [Hymenobacter monticola]|uniref:Uncharacterized protein n=1 Tax=Hymenobacter monticola TaxID=1705399 RepID=A0ABY4B0W9_9BACT|nr:hypothetical protein [Hymenobacter monticola]UOE32813.1 hypothetical protein MTP16_16960 [Hymenobacter monticola]
MTVLSESEVAELLHCLCVRLGFCLPPPLQRRLIKNPPRSVEKFTNAVWKGEGFDLLFISDQKLYDAVRAMVGAAFQQHLSE